MQPFCNGLSLFKLNYSNPIIIAGTRWKKCYVFQEFCFVLFQTCTNLAFLGNPAFGKQERIRSERARERQQQEELERLGCPVGRRFQIFPIWWWLVTKPLLGFFWGWKTRQLHRDYDNPILVGWSQMFIFIPVWIQFDDGLKFGASICSQLDPIWWFLCSSLLGGNYPIWRAYFFRWVETTN